MNRLRWLGLVVLLQGVLLGCSGGASGPSSELRLDSFAETAQVDAEFDREQSFSFVVIGCNRINPADVTPDNPSTANREQLNRTFREVAALRPAPRFLFFVGDLVLGYTDDPNLVEQELTAWRELYEASPLADTDVQLIAIPSNHETQGASSPKSLSRGGGSLAARDGALHRRLEWPWRRRRGRFVDRPEPAHLLIRLPRHSLFNSQHGPGGSGLARALAAVSSRRE